MVFDDAGRRLWRALFQHVCTALPDGDQCRHRTRDRCATRQPWSASRSAVLLRADRASRPTIRSCNRRSARSPAALLRPRAWCWRPPRRSTWQPMRSTPTRRNAISRRPHTAALLSAKAKIVIDEFAIRGGSLLFDVGGASATKKVTQLRPSLAQCAHAVFAQSDHLQGALDRRTTRSTARRCPRRAFSESEQADPRRPMRGATDGKVRHSSGQRR